MKTSGRPVNPRKELLHVLPNIERAVNGERNRSCVGLPLKDDLLLYKDQTARSRVILENSRENRACPRMAIWKTRAPSPPPNSGNLHAPPKKFNDTISKELGA